MPEHRLDRAQIRTAFDEVGGETVTEFVGRNLFANSRVAGVALEQLPKSMTRERAAAWP